jgi:hypothetical protein
MTKKDFILLAERIRTAPLTPRERGQIIQVVARACHDSNPRFDLQRFVMACAPGEKDK